MSNQQFLTIAGRWRQHVEIADFEENDAIQLLAALDTEAQQLAATAAGIFAGGFTQ